MESLDASQAGFGTWTEDAPPIVGETWWEDPCEKPYHHGENPWGKCMENDLFSWCSPMFFSRIWLYSPDLLLENGWRGWSKCLETHQPTSMRWDFCGGAFSSKPSLTTRGCVYENGVYNNHKWGWNRGWMEYLNHPKPKIKNYQAVAVKWPQRSTSQHNLQRPPREFNMYHLTNRHWRNAWETTENYLQHSTILVNFPYFVM